MKKRKNKKWILIIGVLIITIASCIHLFEYMDCNRLLSRITNSNSCTEIVFNNIMDILIYILGVWFIIIYFIINTQIDTKAKKKEKGHLNSNKSSNETNYTLKEILVILGFVTIISMIIILGILLSK